MNPKNLDNTSNFEGWGLTLVAYKVYSKPFVESILDRKRVPPWVFLINISNFFRVEKLCSKTSLTTASFSWWLTNQHFQIFLCSYFKVISLRFLQFHKTEQFCVDLPIHHSSFCAKYCSSKTPRTWFVDFLRKSFKRWISSLYLRTCTSHCNEGNDQWY